MSVLSPSQTVERASAPSMRLFGGCFAAIFATSCGFIVRALLLNDFGQLLNLSEAQKGAVQGAGLYPFAISIVLFSLFIDRIGYGRIMVLAFLGHIAATAITILAISWKHYVLLYTGTLILALANGAVEAVTNPVTATLFPQNKTRYLNILHAGWPGGLWLGGIMVLLMGDLDLRWKLALVFIPTLIYGVMLLNQKFPVQERVAAGISYRDMMREFGAAGAMILAYFLLQAFSTILTVAGLHPISQLASIAFAAVVALAFFARYRSFGRPLFVFLLLIMILLATTELGVDSWVTDLMTPVFGRYAGWILIYTSIIMFILRFFAGGILHRISPLTLLCICSLLAALGLLSLSTATSALLVFLAATLYGVGKSFFWPTTLGVVSEQFPKGGALTLNAMGGMGMIAVGVLGGPFLGTILDHQLDRTLNEKNPAIYASIADEPVTSFGMSQHPLDKSKLQALPADQQQIVNDITAKTKQGLLAFVALLPATMFVCYLALIFWFAARGGYKSVSLSTSASGSDVPRR
jgi:MFS family permease